MHFFSSTLIVRFGFVQFYGKSKNSKQTHKKWFAGWNVFQIWKTQWENWCSKNRSRFLSLRMLKMILMCCMKEQTIPYFISLTFKNQFALEMIYSSTSQAHSFHFIHFLCFQRCELYHLLVLPRILIEWKRDWEQYEGGWRRRRWMKH